MIKVVELLNTLGMGGAESLVVEYAKFINKAEFELVVIVGDYKRGTANEKKLRDLGIKTVFIGDYLKQNINRWDYFGKIKRKFRREKAFYESIKAEKPDVIHGHQHVNHYIYNYVKKDNRPTTLYYTVHSIPSHIFRKKEERIVTNKLIHIFGLRLIALQNHAAMELNDMFGIKNTLVINNCINVSSFLNATRDRSKFGIPEESYVIGNVGRMNWIKNQLFLIDIFEVYKKTHPSSFLLIVGDGDLKDELVGKLKKKGLSASSLILSNRSDIPDLMKVMDCFVFPSLHEGFGLVVIEAQACGLKCVISDKIPQETIVSELVSVVCTEDEIDKWILGIETEYYKVEKKHEIGEYDIRNIIKIIEEIYRVKL